MKTLYFKISKYYRLTLKVHLNVDPFPYSYKLTNSGNYVVPLLPNKENSLEYVSTFSFSPEPEVFGLHENADISKNNNETNSVY